MKGPNPEASKKRTRTSTPRVKTGCGICRKRHVKCDEARPFCTRCVRAGWTCDGYPQQEAAGRDSNKLVSRQVATVPGKLASLNISSYSLPFRIPGSQKDRQVLHYFCAQGSSDISGVLNSNFWSHTILQNSYHEPAVRQALVALSSLHLDFTTSDSRRTQAAAVGPLHQHGKALRMLNRRLMAGGSEAIKAALLCCVLFFCFESSSGNTAAALQHLNQGLGILSSDLMKNTTVEDIDSITNMFVRLDLQATMFDDQRLPFLELVSAEERLVGIIKDPDVPFKSLEEAQKSLDRLQNWLMHIVIRNSRYSEKPEEPIPLDIRLEREVLLQDYDRWPQKLSSMINKPGQDEDICGIQTLLLHHRITQMVLLSRLPYDNSAWTVFPNPAAEEALGHAESILNHLQKRNATAETAKNPRRSLASDTGVIAPLAMLAVKCADEAIHKKAMQLLVMSQRQEGLYDAMTIVQIVQGFNEVKGQRVVAAMQEGVEDATPKALEYWTADIICGAPNELVTRNDSTPRTILHPLTSLADTSPDSF